MNPIRKMIMQCGHYATAKLCCKLGIPLEDFLTEWRACKCVRTNH